MIVHSQTKESIEAARAFINGLAKPVGVSVMVVAAHPDDEIIGAGGHIHLWRDLTVVHVTDGAPIDPRFARDAGFATASSYASARKQEAKAALAVIALPAERIISLAFNDLETSTNLVEIEKQLSDLLLRVRPDIIVTHAYEGGHPDHDSTCFAVHTACATIKGIMGGPPAILEMSSYFGRDGVRVTSSFLTNSPPPTRISLDPPSREQKRRMFACYATQEELLKEFPIEVECFRPAPEYDFCEPPYLGRLFYEYHDLGMSGVRWRHLAHVASSHILGSHDCQLQSK